MEGWCDVKIDYIYSTWSNLAKKYTNEASVAVEVMKRWSVMNKAERADGRGSWNSDVDDII